MTTFFLRKKIYTAIATSICFLFVVLSLLYGVFLRRTYKVVLDTAFYLLVSEETHLEVGAEFIKLEGGAGYFLHMDGKDYLLMSVYLKEDEGESVCAALSGSGKSVRLLPIYVEHLYFKGGEKSAANTYVSALNMLKSYLSVINACVTALDKGETQEGVKRILMPLCRQLEYLAENYKTKYLAFSRGCGLLATELRATCGEIVYARDLRYIACGLVDEYLQLCRQFAL